MKPKSLLKEAVAEISRAASLEQLQVIRVRYLGRKGKLTSILRSVGNLGATERKKVGREANQAKLELERALAKAEQKLWQNRLEAESSRVAQDLTVPGLAEGRIGYLHPLNSLIEEIIYLFWQMGFEVVQGPEIETEYYNFDALNIPPHHPARDLQDTFYLEGGNLPRTHTSPVQIRFMESGEPPFRIIAPGKVFRNEDEDPTHLWMFNQVEGLVVDKGISIADLKGTLLNVMKGLLGEQTEVKLRQSYFPYTEPSVEVDATCVICRGKGCHTCKGTGWLELLGAGLVHRQVLKNVNLDPDVYSGFAFGVGVERLAAIKYQIPDIRYLWRPDLKFLEQF